MYKVDNAIIMAAGASSRFAPLSYEMPKALIPVKGEVLIERQIKQLREAGINEIIVVVGYMKECFSYLKDKFGVIIVENNDYDKRNNNSTIYAVKEYLGNSYICSSDNYFKDNPFENEVDDGYYAAIYADGETKEWCMTEDSDGYVDSVTVGGRDAWFMLGHAFWTKEFSNEFLRILEATYDLPETAGKLWESIYMEHLDTLKLRIRKYPSDFIFEFDSLDELREFDDSYVNNTRSKIIAAISSELGCREGEMTDLKAVKDDKGITAIGFEFTYKNQKYTYFYETKEWRQN